MAIRYAGFGANPLHAFDRLRAARVRNAPARISCVRDALIRPFADRNENAAARPAGVYAADGAPVDDAVMRRYGRVVTKIGRASCRERC